MLDKLREENSRIKLKGEKKLMGFMKVILKSDWMCMHAFIYPSKRAITFWEAVKATFLAFKNPRKFPKLFNQEYLPASFHRSYLHECIMVLGWGTAAPLFGLMPISFGQLFRKNKIVFAESSNISVRLELHDGLTIRKMSIPM